MEKLSMGPGPRSDDDTLLQVTEDSDAEPVDLGLLTPSAANQAEPAGTGTSRDADASWDDSGVIGDDHWLSGLARPDVLGVSGAAVLLLLAMGLPVMTQLQRFPFYGGPVQAAVAWTFLPSVVAASVAGVLGFGGLRQAARCGAPSWARVVSGVAAVVGTLVAIGVALVWFIAVQGDLANQLR